MVQIVLYLGPRLGQEAVPSVSQVVVYPDANTLLPCDFVDTLHRAARCPFCEFNDTLRGENIVMVQSRYGR